MRDRIEEPFYVANPAYKFHLVDTGGATTYELYAQKATSGGAAVYGFASAQAGSTARGVMGITDGTGADAAGVCGQASAGTNTGYAVHAISSSATGLRYLFFRDQPALLQRQCRHWNGGARAEAERQII